MYYISSWQVLKKFLLQLYYFLIIISEGWKPQQQAQGNASNNANNHCIDFLYCNCSICYNSTSLINAVREWIKYLLGNKLKRLVALFQPHGTPSLGQNLKEKPTRSSVMNAQSQISISISKASMLLQALNVSVQDPKDKEQILKAYNATLKELTAIGNELAVAFNFARA